MAIAFTPKHASTLIPETTSPQHFLALVVETARALKLEISHLSGHGIIAYTDNGMFSWNAELTVRIENDTAVVQSKSTGSEMVDWGRNKRKVKEFISKFQELQQSIPSEQLDTTYLSLQDQLAPATEDVLILPPPTTQDQIKDFFSVFKPVEGYFITPVLLNLNILLFVLMVIGGVGFFEPESDGLLKWGANFKPMTMNGQWWRLITNCFIHIGVFHLLLNMYALLYIGVLLEPILGKPRMVTAYLLTGLTASITSLAWHELTISAGASGAIFGLYGVFLALLTSNLIEKTARKALLTSIGIFVAYNLLNGLKGGIDNAAHIGGLIGGLLIGYAFIPGLKNNDDPRWKYGTISILTLLIVVITAAVYNRIPNYFDFYETKMKKFTSMESMALEVYNLPENTPKEKLLYEIRERGIYYWNEKIKLLNDLSRYQLPEEVVNRNRILLEYCNLRIGSYELLYKAVNEDTDRYNAQIEEYNKQIQEKINEISQE